MFLLIDFDLKILLLSSKDINQKINIMKKTKLGLLAFVAVAFGIL